MTFEAFADTFVPGAKRTPGDQAVAGVCDGPGAVAAGAIELLETPATGMSEGLDDAARALNQHARAYAGRHGLALDASLPAFVALPFPERGNVVGEITATGHPEKDIWILIALFCFMAFDTAAHMHTTDAISSGHPGLTSMGFATPDADGLWRFADYSYGRPLARLHPHTTSSGSPA